MRGENILSGSEADLQARRRTLLVLEDEVRRVTDAARVLREEYQAVLSGDKASVKAAQERIKKAEEDVVSLRRALIRELAQVGTLLMNKEDLLRVAFAIESVIGHLNGTAFKLSQVRKNVIRLKRYKEPFNELLNSLVEAISKQNDCVRALSINPDQSIEMAAQVQKLESAIDTQHRELFTELIKSIHGYRDLMTMRDLAQAIEDTADAAMAAADATTIVALGV
ncbi:MAG: DUF47 family protein [Thaumarchaeota archaeon]|nr:DUF47 family protein [Nitrososphaerota archaeon]